MPVQSDSIRFEKWRAEHGHPLGGSRYPTAPGAEFNARLSGGDTMTLAGRARGRANP